MEQQKQQEMELLLDLFEHEGWKLFVEEKETLLNTLKENADTNCPTNDMWQYNRGMLAILRGVTSYEASIKFVMEQDEEDYEQE